REAAEQVHVHRKEELRIDLTDGAEDLPAPESARLLKAHHTVEIWPGRKRDEARLLEDPFLRVDDVEISVEDVHGLPPECGGHGRERSGEIEVVRVQPREDLAGGAAEPLIQRIALPAIGLTDPVVEIRLILPDEIQRPIGRAPVDEDELQIGV